MDIGRRALLLLPSVPQSVQTAIRDFVYDLNTARHYGFDNCERDAIWKLRKLIDKYGEPKQ